jgi:cobalamin biosynthesis protein CobW
VLRVKGFVAVAGKPMRLAVQAVGDRVESYFDRPWQGSEAGMGKLVVIGLSGLDAPAIQDILAGATQAPGMPA